MTASFSSASDEPKHNHLQSAPFSSTSFSPLLTDLTLGNLTSNPTSSPGIRSDPIPSLSHSNHELKLTSNFPLTKPKLSTDHTSILPSAFNLNSPPMVASTTTASKRRSILVSQASAGEISPQLVTNTSTPDVSPNPSSKSTTMYTTSPSPSSPSSLQPILGSSSSSPNTSTSLSYLPHSSRHPSPPQTTKLRLASLFSWFFPFRKSRTHHPSRHRHPHSSDSLSGYKDTKHIGVPWQQVIVFEEGEQVKAFVYLYHISNVPRYLYYFLCVITLGVVYLLSRWFPFLWIQLVGRPVAHVDDSMIHGYPAQSTSTSPLSSQHSNSSFFSKSDASYPMVPKKGEGEMWVCIRNSWGQIFLEQLKYSRFQGPLTTVFPGDPSTSFLYTLVFFDYRCFRCTWHPFKKRFISNSHWKDPSWYTSTLETLAQFKRSGIAPHQAYERYQLFDLNDIRIPQPSTISLLFNEILHPFYIFQLFSILLWSLDSYYTYASCILAISIVSTTVSLIETKRNIQRLCDLSHFSCQVHVLRDQQWCCVSSQELVPGDVFEINMNDFSIFPCDALLLSGDCIVDESMLTGESVPVSKIHTRSISVLEEMDIHQPQISKQLHKCFLYAGTHLIRVRSDMDDFTAAIPPAPLPPKLGCTSIVHPGSPPETTSSTLTSFPSSPMVSTKVLAMVVRTGFNTTKGSLVRSMLFPKPHYFKFYKDSFKFIGILSMFGVLGFFFTLYNFIQLGEDVDVIIKRALDVITLIVSPIIPAAMSVGTTWALRRLRQKKVFCISPNHVNVGGKVSLACFDKTGTLTEHGLDVLGVHLASGSSFSKLYTSPQTIPQPFVIDLLASCHELKMHHQELLGDPLDTKMFEWVGWTLEESVFSTTVTSNTHPQEEIGIVKHFEFRNELRRMSVLTKKMKSEFMLFCKGAPESLKHICVPSSIPSDFDERLSSLSHHGFRVLAFASRSFPNRNVVKLEKASRMELESELTFLGFLVFVNKLKPGSSEAIETLKRARIRCVMCTGDNLFTAISISRECGIVDKEDDVYLPKFVRDPENPACILGLHWSALECPEKTLDPKTLLPRLVSPHGKNTLEGGGEGGRNVNGDPFMHVAIPPTGKYSLGMTGEVFDYLLECEQWVRDEKARFDEREGKDSNTHSPPYLPTPFSSTTSAVQVGSSASSSSLPLQSTAQRSHESMFPTSASCSPSSSSSSSLSHFVPSSSPLPPYFMDSLWRILYKTQIFARMNPEQKQGLVEKLQVMGYCVAFCGDGANDCGALKAADIGLSLSESEASVAAPFTSSHPDISCVLDLIKEGRAALVTSFSTFKYIALYSFIQFSSVTMLYTVKSNLGDLQFLYIDLLLIWPLTFTMGRSGPYHTLVPKRPTATLLSKKVLTSITCNVLVQLGFQLFLFLHVKWASFYTPSEADPKTQHVTCYENTILFLLTSFLYISVALCFSIGPPYRAPLFSNALFMVSMLVLYGFSFLFVFYPNYFFQETFELMAFPLWYKGVLVGVAFLHLICTWFGETYGYVRFAHFLHRARRTCSRFLDCCQKKTPIRPGTSTSPAGPFPSSREDILSPSSSTSTSSLHPPRSQKLYKVIAKVFEKYEQ